MVWRRMKAAGAVGLQNGVWVLPAGEVVQADILARFQADRAREYDEFKEQCEAFLSGINKETARQKFTFAELEENEQNLQKLETWLAKIQGRDFFKGERAEAAVMELAECRRAFESFAAQVYAQEGMDAGDGA